MKSNIESPSDAVTNVCRNGPISDTVITAVADAKDADPLDVEPLHSAIDPDALDSMFDPRIGTPPTSLELTFTLDDCEVVVRADGEVLVTPPAPEVEPPAVTPVADE